MTDFSRRTLRTWALIEVGYTLVLGALIVFIVPWKTPWASALGLGYAGLSLLAAPGLWGLRRWGWRLGVAGGLLGLLGALVLLSGLAASWAYFHAVYGDFGVGASIGAIVIGSVVFQLLGLVPALKLNALLRRELRHDLGVRRGLRGLILGVLSLPLLTGFAVHEHLAYDLSPPLQPAQAQRALEYLRASAARQTPPSLDSLAQLPGGPIFATLWRGGASVARVQASGDTLASALTEAGRQLGGNRAARQGGGRLQLDRVVGVAPTAPPLALSVNPGLDGLKRADAPWRRALLPHELNRSQVFGKTALIPQIRELRLGMAVDQVTSRLQGEGPIQRFRTEVWIESEDQAVSVFRGSVPGPTGPQAWHQAGVAAGTYVLNMLKEDGSFGYRYYPLTDQVRGKPRGYSVARHGGAAMSLAELYAETGEARFAEGARAADDWIISHASDDCGVPGARCMVSRKGVAETGTTALSALALLEYQRATGEPRFTDTARAMVRFLRGMQRPDGEFHHAFDTDDQALRPAVREMFASEEAALALVVAHQVLGEPLEPARRALDYLTGPKYHTLLGQFIYGADVWTCIAADRAWPELDDPGYLDFCLGYSHFLRRIQYHEAGWDNRDFIGHYGFGAFMVPQAPATAGFGEAVVATASLARKHGRPAPEVEEQMRLGLDALTRDQVRPANSWMMPDPARARGAIRRSLVEQMVRIDFPQHSIGTLLGGARLSDAG